LSGGWLLSGAPAAPTCTSRPGSSTTSWAMSAPTTWTRWGRPISTRRPRTACWSSSRTLLGPATGDDYKALTEQTSGNYAGLGIQIDVRGRLDHGGGPLPETPAERAGVQTATRSSRWTASHRGLEERRGGQGAPRRSREAGVITVRRSGIPDPSSSISSGPDPHPQRASRAPCSTAASGISRSNP
jgi:hypothetical protein